MAPRMVRAYVAARGAVLEAEREMLLGQ